MSEQGNVHSEVGGSGERRRSSLYVSDAWQELKVRVLEAVHTYFEGRSENSDEVSDEQLRVVVARSVAFAISGNTLALNRHERDRLNEEVMHELGGLGPIQQFLDDPEIDDIIVNGPDRIYVERNGQLDRVEARFKDNTHLLKIIHRIVGPLGRRVDEMMPFVDARLPDGSRVNVVVPPVSIDGPMISIRKFRRIPLAEHDLIRLGTASKEMMEMLAGAVRARLNIVISGGTGTGKSTLLNVLSSYVNPRDRIVTIEDAAELQLRQTHVVRLETRLPNPDGSAEISARSILRNTLRMRPDRIVVGEVRGVEAVEMLQAMTTGHDGSMTTLHANTARDALDRLELLLAFGGLRVSEKILRRQIASAIDLVVHLQRFPDGTRRITEIVEVVGIEGDRITLRPLYYFRWNDRNNTGEFVCETRRGPFRGSHRVALSGAQ